MSLQIDQDCFGLWNTARRLCLYERRKRWLWIISATRGSLACAGITQHTGVLEFCVHENSARPADFQSCNIILNVRVFMHTRTLRIVQTLKTVT